MNLLNEHISLITKKLIEYKKSISVVFMNPHSYCLNYYNDNYKKSISNNSFLLIDGVLLQLSLFLRDKRRIHRNIGEKSMYYLLENLPYKKILILGPSKEKGELFINSLRKKNIKFNYEIFNLPFFHNVINSQHLEEIINKINNSNIDLIINTIGAPKQEILAYQIIKNINYKLIILNVGAVIDYTTNKKFFLLKFFRKIRLEWFYRFCLSPIKIGKRIFISGPLFIFLFLMNK
jgi:exopolysaccharide biosynthesis WecB/TagA/CpsF family protein